MYKLRECTCLLGMVIVTFVPHLGEELKDIWVIGLFPFNGSWAGGLGQEPAVQMGIRDVNADPSMLPGYRLRMTVDDTQCDAGLGTNALFRHLYGGPTKLMVLGAGCSMVSETTARVSHLWNLVQLSYSSASPALSEKSEFPSFFRVFPPETSFNPAKIELLKTFKWKRVGTLTETDLIFSMTTREMIAAAHSNGIQIVTSESFSASNPRQHVHNLKKHGVKIIIGNFYETSARIIFCEAYKLKMYGAKYAWIITGFFTPRWWSKKSEGFSHDCTPEQILEAAQGYFTADALPLSLSQSPGISGKTYKQFAAEYRNITNNAELTGHQESPYGYDSAWVVANMLNRSLNYMQESGWKRRIEDFQYNDTEMAQLFLEMMNTTSFEGVSGPLMFDSKGDRKGLTQIEQLQGEKEVRVGFYDPRKSSESKITWEEDTPIRWLGGVPPPDSITEKLVPKVISLGLFIGLTVLSSAGIVLACFFFLFNIKYRHRRYIKMSSPNMNNIILAGAILAYFSIIFGGIHINLVTEHFYLVMCKFYTWTLCLSFSLAFGAMFSKTWRVHKIFTNKKIQRTVIKDYQLMAIVCVLVGLDVSILIVWEFADPLRVVRQNRTLESRPDPQNDNQLLIPQTVFCESPHMWYFAGIIYMIKGLILVFGAFLAFETRRVTVPALNDSKFIGISVYNVVVLCLVGVPIAFIMKDQVDASYALISAFIFFATSVTICLVFIPKILKRNHELHSGQLWNKTGDSAANTKKTALTSMTEFDKRQVQILKEENNTLKQALEQSRRRIRELEAVCVNVNGAPLPRSDSQESMLDDSGNDNSVTPVLC